MQHEEVIATKKPRTQRNYKRIIDKDLIPNLGRKKLVIREKALKCIRNPALTVYLTLEASQPDGATYRLYVGCKLHSQASIVALIARLF